MKNCKNCINFEIKFKNGNLQDVSCVKGEELVFNQKNGYSKTCDKFVKK